MQVKLIQTWSKSLFSMLNKVCILADKHDWHSLQLSKSFNKNNIEITEANFEDLSFQVEKNKFLIFLKDKIFDCDGVWVRYINGGSIEEITFKLSVLHLIELSGIYVHNSADIIERTIDKFRASSTLAINKIPTPNTIIKTMKSNHRKDSLKLFNKGAFLHKPILGSQGKGIFCFKNVSEFNKKNIPDSILYLQNFLGNPKEKEFKDLRILVSNHKIVASVERISHKFITNASMGARIKEVKPNPKIKDISSKVSAIFKLGYGGLDLKYFNSDYYVLEINSIPSWKATQKVTERNISDLLVKDFLDICKYERQKFCTLS